MQQCSELASAVAGRKVCAPVVHNTGFISGHADLNNGQPNSVSDQSKPMKTAMLPEPAAAGGGLSWANCCARPPDNDDGVFTEVSYKKAVKATAQQKVIPVVHGTKKTTSFDCVCWSLVYRHN